MKTWQGIFIFVSAVTVIFFASRGYSNLALAVIYLVILLTGGAVFLIASWLERAEVPWRLKLVLFCPLCRDCLPLIPENHAPVYEGGEIVKDDYSAFLEKHRGHSFHYLSIILGPWQRKGKSASDPIKNELFLAKGRGGLFLLSRSRIDVHESLAYRAFPLWHPKAFVCWFGWAFGLPDSKQI